MIVPPFSHVAWDSTRTSAESVLDELAAAIPVRLVAVSRVEGTTIMLAAVRDQQARLKAGLYFPLDDTLCMRVITRRQPLIVTDMAETGSMLDIPVVAELGIQAFVGVRVEAEQMIWGSVWAAHNEAYPFSEREVRCLSEAAATLQSALMRDLALQQAARYEVMDHDGVRCDPRTGLLEQQGFIQQLESTAHQQRKHRVLVMRVRRADGQCADPAAETVIDGFANLLMRASRMVDICARVSNDSFAALLPDASAGDVVAWRNRLTAGVATWNLLQRAAPSQFQVITGSAASDEATGQHLLELAVARSMV